jgi:hypothetical protein
MGNRMRKRQRKTFSFANLRLREIERIVPTLDCDQMHDLLPEVACALWVILTQRGRPLLDGELPMRIGEWCVRAGMPKFTKDEVGLAAKLAMRRNRLAQADKLATVLDLHDADRHRLAITTIGAVDKTKRQRLAAYKQRKRVKDLMRKAVKRRAAIKPSRSEWLSGNHHSRTRPWKRAGMSRASWYRRRQNGPLDNYEIGCSPTYLSLPVDTPVSELSHDSPALPSDTELVVGFTAEIGLGELLVSQRDG